MLQTGGRSTGPVAGRLAAASVVAIVGLGTVLAGCSNPEPAPIDEPTSEPASPTKTQTPSPTPSETPTASPGSVEAQLHAATTAFYTAVTESLRTLDTEPIQAVIVPGSRAGSFYLDAIRKVKAKNHRYTEVPTFQVKDFKLEPQDADSEFETVTFTLGAGGSTEVDENGKVVESLPAGSANGVIEFMRKDGRWLVLSQRFNESD